jgi:hypothetical protein
MENAGKQHRNSTLELTRRTKTAAATGSHTDMKTHDIYRKIYVAKSSSSQYILLGELVPPPPEIHVQHRHIMYIYTFVIFAEHCINSVIRTGRNSETKK